MENMAIIMARMEKEAARHIEPVKKVHVWYDR